MSRDIVADIVRRALAPEPVSEDGRLLETPLEQRLRLLHNALGGTQQKVLAQQQKLETLRRELDEYRALMEQVKQRAVAAERAAKLVEPAAAVAVAAPVLPPAPAPAEAPVDLVRLPEVVPVTVPVGQGMTITVGSLCSAAESPAPAPRPEEVPVPVSAALPAGRFAWLPYAALAAVGLSLSLGLSWREPARASLKVAAVPPPAAAAPTLSAAAQISDEEANIEALALVYSFVPPGGKRSVQDLLGPEISAPASESPWNIMRVDEKTTLVSFRPYGDVLETAPVYEFVVDPVAKTVTASPETLANLKGSAVAAR